MFEGWRKTATKVERVEDHETNPNEFTAEEIAMIERVLADAPPAPDKAGDVPAPKVDPNMHPVMEGEALQNFFDSAKDSEDPVMNPGAGVDGSSLDKAA